MWNVINTLFYFISLYFPVSWDRSNQFTLITINYAHLPLDCHAEPFSSPVSGCVHTLYDSGAFIQSISLCILQGNRLRCAMANNCLRWENTHTHTHAYMMNPFWIGLHFMTLLIKPVWRYSFTLWFLFLSPLILSFGPHNRHQRRRAFTCTFINIPLITPPTEIAWRCVELMKYSGYRHSRSIPPGPSSTHRRADGFRTIMNQLII